MDFFYLLNFVLDQRRRHGHRRRRHRHLLTGRGTRGRRYRGREEYNSQHLHLYHLGRDYEDGRKLLLECSRRGAVVSVHRSSPTNAHGRRSRVKAQPAHAHPTGRRPSSPTPPPLLWQPHSGSRHWEFSSQSWTRSDDAIPTAFGSQRAPQSLRSSRLVHRFITIIMVGTAPWAHTMASALPHSCKMAATSWAGGE